MKQQVLYTGGEIITLDAPARAVLTEGERILAVGSEAALRRMAGPDAREFPLKGQVMLPAFLDSHGHITAFAATLSLAPLAVRAALRRSYCFCRSLRGSILNANG